jgi:hypothetical protein
MTRFFAFIRHEFLRMLPPTIYFLVVFHVLAYVRQLMIEEWGVLVSSSVSATIGALIVGKAVLLADALPIVKRIARTRLAYDIALRTSLYLLVALTFKLLEELIPAVGHEGGLASAATEVFREIRWPHFWAATIFMTIFLLFYNLVTGVRRALGPDEFSRLLWQPVQAEEQRSGSDKQA